MRNLLLSVTSLLLLTGIAAAVEVVFLKYDPAKKELRVKEGDKEATYKVTDTTRVSIIDKDGNAMKSEIKVLEKAKEGKTKLDITTDKDTVTEIKARMKKKN